MTIGFLALAGVPATTGFIGKLYLIEATVDGGFTWLGVAIVIGTMVSMAYYLRVLAAVWMKPAAEPGAMPAIAGASPEADAQPKVKGASRCGLVVGAGVLCAAATVFFGVIPSPLVDWAACAGESLATLLSKGEILLLIAEYTFGQGLLTVLSIFVFMAWIMVLFTILGDLFRDHDTSGCGEGDVGLLPDLHPVRDRADLPHRARQRHARARDQAAGRGEGAVRHLREERRRRQRGRRGREAEEAPRRRRPHGRRVQEAEDQGTGSRRPPHSRRDPRRHRGGGRGRGSLARPGRPHRPRRPHGVGLHAAPLRHLLQRRAVGGGRRHRDRHPPRVHRGRRLGRPRLVGGPRLEPAATHAGCADHLRPDRQHRLSGLSADRVATRIRRARRGRGLGSPDRRARAAARRLRRGCGLRRQGRRDPGRACPRILHPEPASLRRDRGVARPRLAGPRRSGRGVPSRRGRPAPDRLLRGRRDPGRGGR